MILKIILLKIKNDKDIISSKGHNINPNLNEYINLNDFLNNETNPFIIANNRIS